MAGEFTSPVGGPSQAPSGVSGVGLPSNTLGEIVQVGEMLSSIFGASRNNSLEQKKMEVAKAQEERARFINSNVEEIIRQRNAKLAQGENRIKVSSWVENQFSKRFDTADAPEARQLYGKTTGTSASADLRREIIDQEDSLDAQADKLFNSIPKDMLPLFVGERQTIDMTNSEKVQAWNDYTVHAQREDLSRRRAEAAMKAALGADPATQVLSARTFSQSLAENINNGIGAFVPTLVNEVDTLAKLNQNSPEAVERLTQMRSSISNVIEHMKQQVLTSYSNISPSINDASAVKILDREKSNLVARLDQYTEQLSNMDIGGLKVFTQQLELLKTKQGVEAREAFPTTFMVREAFGSELTSILLGRTITADVDTVDKLSKRVGGELSGLLTGTTAQTSAVGSLHNGGEVEDMSVDEQPLVATNYYKFANDVINSNKLEDIKQPDLDKTAVALSKVLQYTDKVPSEENARRAGQLINSNNFNIFFDKLSPAVKESIGGMVVEINRRLLSGSQQGAIKDINAASDYANIKYDANTGLFEEVSLQDIKGYDKLGQLIGGTNINNLSTARRRANDAIKKANKAITQMTKYKEYNKSTSGKSEQELSNFFVLAQPVTGLSNKVSVIGMPVRFESTEGNDGSTQPTAPKPVDRITELENMLELIKNESVFSTLPPEVQQEIMSLVGGGTSKSLK